MPWPGSPPRRRPSHGHHRTGFSLFSHRPDCEDNLPRRAPEVGPPLLRSHHHRRHRRRVTGGAADSPLNSPRRKHPLAHDRGGRRTSPRGDDVSSSSMPGTISMPRPSPAVIASTNSDLHSAVCEASAHSRATCMVVRARPRWTCPGHHGRHRRWSDDRHADDRPSRRSASSWVRTGSTRTVIPVRTSGSGARVRRSDRSRQEEGFDLDEVQAIMW